MTKLEHIYNGKKYPLKEYCSLSEALIYECESIPPVTDNLKHVFKCVESPSFSTEEKQSLIYRLATGELVASGVHGTATKMTPDIDDRESKFSMCWTPAHAIAADVYTAIDPSDWFLESTVWRSDLLLLNGESVDALHYFHEVPCFARARIKTSDLIKAQPISSALSKSAEAYSTVFLKIMQKGIDHFDITHNHQPLVKELIPWFESELAKIGEKAPANKAKLMATFVRLPESQAGGNKRLAKKH